MLRNRFTVFTPKMRRILKVKEKKKKKQKRKKRKRTYFQIQTRVCNIFNTKKLNERRQSFFSFSFWLIFKDNF